MTGSYATATVLLSDKISTVTHHHLLTRVHVKFDLENWNYGSWEFFFDKLCQSYEIVKDNERSRTIVLKVEIRSLKLGDLCMDAYFRKIESIATILTSLGSTVSSEDVVTFSLEGFLNKYDHVYDIMRHRDTFPDLKTARSMLTTEEMWLKFKSQSLPVDSSSSSPVVLMAESGIYRRPSNLQNNTDELLVKLLGHLGLSNNSETPTGTHTHALKHSTVSPVSLVVFYTSAGPGPLYYTTIAQHVSHVGPPGFGYLPALLISPVLERIKRTKRSKNSQKPTRNERDKKKSEETAKDQSRISPTQQERNSKPKMKSKDQE
ncbi:hypothetical protein Tco_1310070 [Tanacetum coccineum]